MKIAIGSDHAGFLLKEKVARWLASPAGGRHRVVNAGCGSLDSCDYPDFASAVARRVSNGSAALGILLCGTGIGMSMAANKHPRVRAAVVWNPVVAGLAAEHNNANVLCIPGRFASFSDAQRMIRTFLKTPFGGGRHLRRVRKINRLDRC